MGIQRKDFRTDRLFDSLEEATDFLQATKSDAGRRQLNDDTAREAAMRQTINEWLDSPKFSHYIKLYKDDSLSIESEQNETKKRGKQAALYRLRALEKIEVEEITPANKAI